VGACLPAEALCIVDSEACRAQPQRYCELGEAARQCRYVLVRGRADRQRYAALTLGAGSLTLIGLSAEAVVGGLEVAGEGTSLSVYDLTIERPTQTAVRCGSGARLALRRTLVQGSRIGVSAEGCRLTIEQSQIRGNQNDGLDLLMGEYRVVNTLIAGNGFDPAALAAGVHIDVAKGTFSFNTVVQNGRKGQDGGGLSCNRPADLTDSILFDNGTGPRGTQLVGACRLARVVVGSDTTPEAGAIKLTPELDPQGHQLTPASTACIDRAEPDRSVRSDYLGTPRPQGQGYDIGFHELR
jgi:hypothetical protein